MFVIRSLSVLERAANRSRRWQQDTGAPRHWTIRVNGGAVVMSRFTFRGVVTRQRPVSAYKERILQRDMTNRDAINCNITRMYLNPLKPTGHVMHQQFNIQQLYALPTLYLCVLYLSENKQRLVPLTA